MANKFREFLAEVDRVLGHVKHYGHPPRRVPWGLEPNYPQTEEGMADWERHAAEEDGTQMSKELRFPHGS